MKKKAILFVGALFIMTGCTPVEETVDNITSQLFEDVDDLETVDKLGERQNQGEKISEIRKEYGENKRD